MIVARVNPSGIYPKNGTIAIRMISAAKSAACTSPFTCDVVLVVSLFIFLPPCYYSPVSLMLFGDTIQLRRYCSMSLSEKQ